MATFSNPDELLLSTTGKANFQRVTRLLITGGTTLLREVFDSRCRPSDLPKILSSPSTKKQLKAAKLTKPQWDCLYPSSGVYGKSTDFDITLLFKLVKIKCNLKPPAAGWEAPPSSADQSLAADLVRIKCYRNSVYAHVNRNMEITDDEFPSLWREISDILIRIAGQINHSKAREWQGAIDKFLKDPLTSQDERNVQELLTWYENDIDVKKNLEELKISVKSVHDEVQRRLSGVSERVEERAQFLETAVREESQNCKHQLGEELKTFVRESQKEVERLETSIQGRATESTYLLETAVREEAQGIKDKLGEELNTSTKEVQEEIERVQETLEGTTNVLERLVRQESQEIKDQLREELRTLSKEVKDMKGRLGEEHQAANGNMASNSAGEMAIPLCLPNNYKWDSERGKCTKEGDERSYLYVVEEALEKLRIIKGPVCVVAIAGPYRNGKSYILSKALDQPPVFPLGHEMLPETVGIWMWILPEKHQDSNGQKYSVVLLDSEGTDSAMGEVKDDNQIFTLTVLLASVLIYNSERVPKRRDVEELKYIVNLSQRIHIKSNIGGEASFGDVNIFHEVFPFFIWLLRDVTLALPSDCVDIKEYFFKKVFPELKSAPEGREVVCSILNFFRGFDAFCLPPPSSDPAVLTTMSHDESQVEPAFVSDVERFKVLLKNLLAPKNSFNAEEFVSGEGLAHMVRSYVEAINTPGAIPNVENAWNVFVKTKCADAKEAAMRKYSAIMMSELKGRLPLDGGEIRKSHDAAFAECENEVIIETAGLSTNTVEDCLDEVKKFTDGTLESWHKQNVECTEEFCNDLIQQLERQHLDPLLQKLGTRHAAILSFQDIIDAYNQLNDDYYRCAIGAKDVIAAVFFKLNLRLQEKMKQGKAQLDILKDYDKRLAEETAARAYQAQETARLQEKLSRQRQDNNDCMKKVSVT